MKKTVLCVVVSGLMALSFWVGHSTRPAPSPPSLEGILNVYRNHPYYVMKADGSLESRGTINTLVEAWQSGTYLMVCSKNIEVPGHIVKDYWNIATGEKLETVVSDLAGKMALRNHFGGFTIDGQPRMTSYEKYSGGRVKTYRVWPKVDIHATSNYWVKVG